MPHCVVCRAETNLGCERCRNVYYCSREHQQQHWRTHHSTCAAFAATTNDSEFVGPLFGGKKAPASNRTALIRLAQALTNENKNATVITKITSGSFTIDNWLNRVRERNKIDSWSVRQWKSHFAQLGEIPVEVALPGQRITSASELASSVDWRKFFGFDRPHLAGIPDAATTPELEIVSETELRVEMHRTKARFVLMANLPDDSPAIWIEQFG